MAKSKETTSVEKREKKGDKKNEPGRFAKFFINLGRKIKETFLELKRVTWPSFGKAVKSTGVVLVIVLIFTLVVTGINYGFSALLDLVTKWGA